MKNFGKITTPPGLGQSAGEAKDCWKYINIKGSVTFSKGEPGDSIPMENPTGGKVTFKYKVTTQCRCVSKTIGQMAAGFDPGVEWDTGGTADVGGCEPDGSRKFSYNRQKLIMRSCAIATAGESSVKCKITSYQKWDEKEYTFDQFLTQTTAAGSDSRGPILPPPSSGDWSDEFGPYLSWNGNQNAGTQICGGEFTDPDGGKTDGLDDGDPNRCEAWFKTLQDTTVECGAGEEAPLRVAPGAPPGTTSYWPRRTTFAPESEDRGEGVKQMADFQKCLLDDLMCPDSDSDVVQAFLNAFLSPNLDAGFGGPGLMTDGPLDDPDAFCLYSQLY